MNVSAISSNTCLAGFEKADGSLHVEVMSGIREYSGNLYVASVGTGDDLRLARENSEIMSQNGTINKPERE
jgi:hypothetical protein